MDERMRKPVLVTGASGGIGGAVAAAFAREGHPVALGCRGNAAAAARLAASLAAEGCRAVVCTADVADEAQVDAMFQTAEEAFGEIGILVNCAGFAQQKMVCDLTAAEWRRMFAVHVDGTFFCCRRAMPAMVRAKDGVILNVSSMWGQAGASCEVHYSAAKAAVIGLTKALAKELGPSGIRVNCIAPGVIETAMLDSFTEGEKRALAEETPLSRLGTPADVAGVALFLASDAAGFLTGQVIAPNGGFVV